MNYPNFKQFTPMNETTETYTSDSTTEQKIKIDLMQDFDKEKTEALIRKKLFKSEPIKKEKTFDPMQIGLQLMANPKKLIILLSVIIFFAVIGLGATATALVYGIIKLF